MYFMGEKMQQLGIDKLGVDERLALLDEIWASVADETVAVPVPALHEAELRQRIAAFEAEPDRGRPFEEVIADIRRGRT
jgi:putative addiction module component (TIGR02574 family)